jgi:pSer/pThr/pTyr-binding forkhead associated (FHA) protein
VNTITFGSGDKATIRVRDQYVSPMHCAVSDDGCRFLVRDLGSTNGTWVVTNTGNTYRVTGEQVLHPGSRVRIGRTTLPWRSDHR